MNSDITLTMYYKKVTVWERMVSSTYKFFCWMFVLEKISISEGKVYGKKNPIIGYLYIMMMIAFVIQRYVNANNEFVTKNTIMDITLYMGLTSAGLGTIYCSYIECLWNSEMKQKFYQNIYHLDKVLPCCTRFRRIILRKIHKGLLIYLIIIVVNLLQQVIQSPYDPIYVFWDLVKTLVDIACAESLIDTFLCAVGFQIITQIIYKNYAEKHQLCKEIFKENSIYENMLPSKVQLLNIKPNIHMDILIECCETLKESVYNISNRYGILMLIVANNCLVGFVMGASYLSGGADILKLSNVVLGMGYVMRKAKITLITLMLVCMTEILKYHYQILTKTVSKILIYTKKDDDMITYRFLMLLNRMACNIQQFGVKIDLTLILSLVAITTSYVIVMIQTNTD